MKYPITYFLVILFVLISHVMHADVYYVFYATINGKSGHSGIAIDNYKIIVKDMVNDENKRISIHDTIKDGTLTYYDLWPAKDDFNAFNVDEDVPAKYFKLPTASWENPITVKSLLQKGIPHEEHYPVDGLIKLKSSPKQDSNLKKYIKTLIEKKQSFNVRAFNCADFVEIILEKHLNINIKADEVVFLKLSTTPNRLYQEISKLKNIVVIKDASEKAKGSFTNERLIKNISNK